MYLGKVKVYRDRPRWPKGPRIFSTFCTTRVVGLQPNAPAAFTPGEIPGTHFQRLSRPQGTWFCRKEPRKKSQVTPPEIDPGTVRLVFCIDLLIEQSDSQKTKVGFVLFNTFTAIVDLSRFNNSCLKSPGSTLVDLTFQSRALSSFSLNQLRNLSL